jgi:LAO/AO transport system kinase
MMLDLDSVRARSVMHHGRLLEAVGMDRDAGTEPEETEPWRPPIHQTVATRGEGIAELAGSIAEHWNYLHETGGFGRRERERAAAELETIIQQESLRAVLDRTGKARLEALIDQIVGRELDPFTASQCLLGN